MLSKLFSASTFGTEAYLLEIEVDVTQGLPAVSVVGLPDAAVKESRDRVKSAIKTCGYEYPTGRITVNLAPADFKKEGSAFRGFCKNYCYDNSHMGCVQCRQENRRSSRHWKKRHS